MSETFWTGLGAVGGTLAFFGVVWQAYLTHRALKVSQLMTADAIRSRLDAQAPDVSLELSTPPWEPRAWTSMGMPCNTWPAGHTWHFPAEQEGSNRLVLQQILILKNQSDRRIQARFDGDLVAVSENRPTAAGVLLLEPGETSPDIYLQRDFTIKELSENFEARQAGLELPHQVRGTVTVEDDRDNGSTDRWDLVLTGCPVEPVPDRDGLWQIAPWHLTEGSGLRTLDYSLLPPRQRLHWVSRAKGIQLPAPDAA
ncbi:hypothetical protein GCM10018980_68520 [Streptomyces capoamus]|uniref:Uncharacterized protein n=1 Tax=Streptomyces capoamus TaxID=68183 RepID=A0A919KF84_9ACTN|nr:hypothetical protein [Streptomyces capoamus]GGP32395.1 hypothetical protein GCM10010501_74870 [Streptomyces libani subsp. rufus]GHG72608.1 hypothetical protein GCM10018980_68520 [Streptomyces capoamus]